MADGNSTLTSDVARAHDVFISYAHSDDGVPPDEPKTSGFVTRLVARIRQWGHQGYGEKLKLFFDVDLASGTLWKPSIFEALDSCRIFVPIVSPSWLNSKWCGKEWDAVWKRVSNEHMIGNQTRIIPVSFELDRLLEKLREGTYSAEQKEMQRRILLVKELELKRRFRTSMSPDDYKNQAIAVVDDIVDLLDKLKNTSSVMPASSVIPASRARSKVFLGFAFSDEMRTWKKNIRNELKTAKFDVGEVPFRGNETAQELRETLETAIRDSTAVVHFLEKRPGPYVEGDRDRGIVEIQCEVANQMEDHPAQFFWSGPDLKLKDVQEGPYKVFLGKVSGLDEHMTEHVLTFSKSLLSKLKQLREPSPPPLPPLEDNEGPVICVICEDGDRDIAEDIRAHFTKEKGWLVTVPKVDIEPHVEQRSVSSSYASAFRDNEYFLFYWGKGTEDWCSDNLEYLIDARRIPGGKVRHPRAALLYCGQKKTIYKENPRFWKWLTAPKWDRYDPTAKEVRDFIRLVESGPGSSSTSAGGQVGL